MKGDTVRTSLDIPKELHRRLHEAAARQGLSARKLILLGIEKTLDEVSPQRPQRRLSLEEPIVPSRGKPFNLTNDELHGLLEFP